MKNTQLLSVVFSLIMFTGVTAGNTAFAESDDLDDILERFCDMTESERIDIISKYDLDEYAEKLAIICEMEDNDEREHSLDDVIDAIELETFGETDDDSDDVIKDFEDCVEAGYPIMESFPEQCMTDDGQVFTNTDDDSDDIDDDRYEDDFDLDDLLDRYCELNTDKKRQFLADHPRLAPFTDRLANYCDLSEEEQDEIDDLIEEHRDKIRAELRDYSKDYVVDDKKYMDYDKFCEMSESDLSTATFDVEFVERASKWCEMTPEEREDYKEEHHDNKMHDFDGMSDMAKHNMSDIAKAKLSENSERLKTMIMDKRDISDEKHDEIRMKFESKFGEESDKKRSEIKMKYKEHMLKMKFKMSDEHKSDVHERLAEMKAFKAELREKSSELSDEEKQQLREEFIEKAKDMQLAWISPRTQMTAGIDAAEIECREGYNLVMKTSNGAAMCLKAESALKMIDRGIVVPAN